MHKETMSYIRIMMTDNHGKLELESPKGCQDSSGLTLHFSFGFTGFQNVTGKVKYCCILVVTY